MKLKLSAKYCCSRACDNKLLKLELFWKEVVLGLVEKVLVETLLVVELVALEPEPEEVLVTQVLVETLLPDLPVVVQAVKVKLLIIMNLSVKPKKVD